MALAPGSTLGPYAIRSQLGQGGMGVVYLAQDPRLKRLVAIKLLPPDLTRDATAKQPFLQEAQAASALDHPNICTIFEINETADGQLYLVMAHYEGETLKERIGRGPLAVDDAIDIASQVGQGLAKAPAAGIVHRDIKPANLMVTADGTVKILDFGLAKLMGSESMTGSAATLGTVAYMSPEQAQGRDVDGRTDIWSLGAVLYEMVTGQIPFEGENLLAIAHAIQHGQPTPLTTLRNGAPTELQRVVSRTLAKRLENRYPTAADLLAELRTVTRTLDSAGAAATVAEKAVPSIAVLPFADMSPGKDQDYFCEGVAEELIDALTKLKGLRVAARTSSFQFKGREGSVRKAGNRLRVTAQLVNTTDGFHLWSERYDRDLDDVFAVQDEIARSVVDQLKVELLGEPDTALITQGTESLEAYQSYLRAQYYRLTAYDLRRALEWYERALAQDASLAAAHAGLADCLVVMQIVLGVLPPKVGGARVQAATTAALEIDDRLALAHTVRGIAQFTVDWDWAEATRAFERGQHLDPSGVRNYVWYGIFLVALGQSDDGIAHGSRVETLEPVSPYAAMGVGLVYALAGRFELAEDRFTRALDLRSDFFPALLYRGWARSLGGRHADAVSDGRRLTAQTNRATFAIGSLAWILARGGARDEARSLLDEVNGRAKSEYVGGAILARGWASVGHREQALSELERGYEERDVLMAFLASSFFADLRGTLAAESRFQAILRRMNFPETAAEG